MSILPSYQSQNECLQAAGTGKRPMRVTWQQPGSNNRPTATLDEHSIWGTNRAMAVRCLQGCKRPVYRSGAEAAGRNAQTSRSQSNKLQASLLHHCKVSPVDPWHGPPSRPCPVCSSVQQCLMWYQRASLSVRGFYNHSWSGARKSSCLWVNYFEASKRRLVLKSSITYLWWTAYKSPAGNGEEWAGVPVEHLKEFAYTSQMKWFPSCGNSKNKGNVGVKLMHSNTRCVMLYLWSATNKM